MIKLATMSSVCPDWDLGQVIDGMKRHGYQGLEPRVEWGHASGIELDLSTSQRQQVRQRLADEGLEICCIATGVRMAASDAAERAVHIEDLRAYIDLAADLGCGLIRTFGGPRDKGREWPLVVDYVVDGYRQVLDKAGDSGVTLLMETHDDWCCAAPVRAVVEQVDHPRLQVLWDFMHTQRMMENPAISFEQLGRHTLHTHAHDGHYVDGRMQVSGELGGGAIDHAEPLRLLHGAGFAGYFSIEVIHKPGSDHDANAVLASYAEGFRRIVEGG
ncbi:MAG: TIM barrel protein [Candidatus Latescibacteria bacterium]|nr:TIM barrel protein [Candidatus Latescibacterota bacterium]